MNASNIENQEKRLQGNPFRPFDLGELRSSVPPVCIRNFNLDDTMIINEDHTGEDKHTCRTEKQNKVTEN